MTTSYDSQNRLVSVYQGTNEVATYTYDSAGRRHSKSLASSGTTTTYLYDNDSPANVLVEYEGGTWVRAFVYGPGTDQPLCMIEPDGGIYYYHQDALGSVIALSDSTGALVERYSYDVFGKPDQTSAVGNPYMFTGRRYDSETGLYYYRARMYHPVLGRFLQTDPIGYEDGINWYAYCGNNPMIWSDPSGLDRYWGWKHWYDWAALPVHICFSVGVGIHDHFAGIPGIVRDSRDVVTLPRKIRNKRTSQLVGIVNGGEIPKTAGPVGGFLNWGKKVDHVAVIVPGTSASGPLPTSPIDFGVGEVVGGIVDGSDGSTH